MTPPYTDYLTRLRDKITQSLRSEHNRGHIPVNLEIEWMIWLHEDFLTVGGTPIGTGRLVLRWTCWSPREDRQGSPTRRRAYGLFNSAPWLIDPHDVADTFVKLMTFEYIPEEYRDLCWHEDDQGGKWWPEPPTTTET